MNENDNSVIEIDFEDNGIEDNEEQLEYPHLELFGVVGTFEFDYLKSISDDSQEVLPLYVNVETNGHNKLFYLCPFRLIANNLCKLKMLGDYNLYLAKNENAKVEITFSQPMLCNFIRLGAKQ